MAREWRGSNRSIWRLFDYFNQMLGQRQSTTSGISDIRDIDRKLTDE